MELIIEPGRYAVAVSGGVDSVVLLDLLAKLPDLELVVAHFDHGIRENSTDDRKFVQNLADKYRLQFEYGPGRLGKVSEATARKARYDFLRKVQQKVGAKAIITAHHQDDLLETAILNMLRGAGRKGLTSLKSRPGLLRPLLKVSKLEIIEYAKKNGLAWREDPTNEDTTYMRNYVRHKLLPRMSSADKAKLIKIFTDLKVTNQEADQLLENMIKRQSKNDQLDRQWFNQLPHDLAREVIASWLRAHDESGFDKRGLERLVVAAKTARPGRFFPVRSGLVMKVGDDYLALGR